MGGFERVETVSSSHSEHIFGDNTGLFFLSLGEIWHLSFSEAHKSPAFHILPKSPVGSKQFKVKKLCHRNLLYGETW